MAENSNISWTDHTFNPWRGCQKISPGCENCYAATLSKRNHKTLGVWGPQGTRVVASEAMWREPLKWNAAAAKAGVRAKVFCASLADVFEDWQGRMVNAAGLTMHKDGTRWYASHVLSGESVIKINDVRHRLFDLIDQTPHLDWLILSKRPENIADMTPGVGWVSATDRAWPVRPTVWFGTSVENQEQADKRIPELLKVPAKVRFLSCEPLLGPLDLSEHFAKWTIDPGIHWVIVGGESGPGYRDCDPAWIASIVEQCMAAGVPCFIKQDSGSKPGQQGRIPLDIWDFKGFPR